MRKFKLKQGNEKVYDLTKKNYIQLTKYGKKYHQKGKDQKVRCFAICPACDNPIQIVGLFKQVKNTDRSYGKHYNHDITIAKHNELAYRYCPYASNRYKIDKDARKEELTDFEIAIYNILRENADFIYYIIKQDTGIYFTRKQFRTLLENFKSNDGYMYYWCSIYNIPWIILHVNAATNCYGLYIRKDSELFEKLKKIKKIALQDTNNKRYAIIRNKDGGYLDLHFAATIHDRKVVNNELQESVTLDFYEIASCGDEPFTTLFKIKLPINETRFLNLIHSEKAQKYRDPEIVAMAKEIFPELAIPTHISGDTNCREED